MNDPVKKGAWIASTKKHLRNYPKSPWNLQLNWFSGQPYWLSLNYCKVFG
jgi:hypothetical protein